MSARTSFAIVLTCLIFCIPIGTLFTEGESNPISNDPPWPMYKGDAQHTSLSPYDTKHNIGTLRWVYPFNDYAKRPVIDGEGTIYVMDTGNNTLHAIHPNGSLKWKLILDAGSESVKTNPAIGKDGNIYIGCKSLISKDIDFLYAIHPNGTILWRYGPIGYFSDSLTIDQEGIIYLISTENYDYFNLLAVYPNGSLKWRYSPPNASYGHSPAVGKNGVIYFTQERFLYAVNPNNTFKWKSSILRHTSSPTLDRNGTIYVSNGFYSTDDDNRLSSFYPNGTLKWKIIIGTTTYKYPTPSIDKNGNIYVTANNSLLSINTNGTLNWEFKVGSSATSTPSISNDGIIYFSSSNGNFYSVLANGTLNWKHNISSNYIIGQSAAIGFDGSVYIIGACPGRWTCLYSFGANYTEPFPPLNLTAIPGNGYVFLQWGKPSFLGGSSIQHYNVYRGSEAGKEDLLITVNGQEKSYIDRYVENGQEYYYYVTAENNNGESLPSKRVKVTPLAILIDHQKPNVEIINPVNNSVIKTRNIQISGIASDNVGIYKVEISKGGDNWVLTNGTVSWSSELKMNEGENTIYVKATDISGNSKTVRILVEYRVSTKTSIEETLPFLILIIILLAILTIWLKR